METVDPAGPVINELKGAVAELFGLCPADLPDVASTVTVVELVKLTSVLDAATAAFVGPWDANGSWADDGSRTPAARLARDTGVSHGSAKGLLCRARALRTMPATRNAFQAGELSTDRVDVLVGANAPARAALFAESENDRVADAMNLESFKDFVRVTRYWCDAADAASDNGDPEEQANRQHTNRHLDVAATLGGTLDIKGLLAPVEGEIFRQELARLEQDLFTTDWAKCRNEHGENATADLLARTATQRRADALVIMATRSARGDNGLVPARPLFSVLVDYPTFTGAVREFFNGTVVSPGQIAHWLTEADIERIVFSGPSRVIDIGAKTRCFTGATRRAIEIRDRHCTFPGCNTEATWCHTDHIIEHTNGGPTTQTNGRLLCPTHNRQRPGQQPTGTDPP